MAIYKTQQNDTVDYVAFRYYGTLDGRTTEQVLEANPGLADLGPLLPMGLTINLPDILPSTTANQVSLWT